MTASSPLNTVLYRIAVSEAADEKMRVRVEVDGALLARAMKSSGLATKRATVEEGLCLLVRLRNQTKALAEIKGVGWEGDLHAMRQNRFKRVLRV